MIMIEEISKSIDELEEEVEMWKRKYKNIKFDYVMDGMLIGSIVTLIVVFLLS